MKANIVVLPGDGIGPEVMAQAVRTLETVAKKGNRSFCFTEQLVGGCSIDAHGVALTEGVLAACQSADAVLLGAVGGPKWDDPRSGVRPEQGLFALRKGLGVFANLRPVAVHPSLVEASPIRPERIEGVNILVIRELTGGLYFGEPKGREMRGGVECAVDTLEYKDFEVRRIVELAFRLARGRKKKVTSVDKANVLESSRMWRRIATEIGEANPDVELEHVLVDTAAMRLIASPATLDVVVTENTFGDILTDEASVLVGSMGMLPSASLNEETPGLYEPIHGSAPDIAGKGIANPVGMILSAAMCLRHSLGLEAEARLVEKATRDAISDGARTVDLGGALSTREMADEVIARIEAA
ncbi:MAG: 3-isopropylmalate dehydrogenase [Acidobacteria bacterium]|nr:3-isopropylmalate dehydrogenase [Acidobacteriota bacterium]